MVQAGLSKGYTAKNYNDLFHDLSSHYCQQLPREATTDTNFQCKVPGAQNNRTFLAMQSWKSGKAFKDHSSVV